MHEDLSEANITFDQPVEWADPDAGLFLLVVDGTEYVASSTNVTGSTVNLFDLSELGGTTPGTRVSYDGSGENLIGDPSGLPVASFTDFPMSIVT